MRKTEKSRDDFDRAIALEPDNGWYRYERALIYLMLGVEEKAEEDLRQAVGIAQVRYDEKRADWWNTLNLALYFLAGGDRVSAARLYEDTLAGGPSEAVLREAIDDLDEFLQLFPQNEFARTMREMLRMHVEGIRDK